MLRYVVHGFQEIPVAKLCSFAYPGEPPENFVRFDEDWLSLRAAFDRIAGGLPGRFRSMDGTGVFEDLLRAEHAWVRTDHGKRLFVPALLGDWFDKSMWTLPLRAWQLHLSSGGTATQLVERSGHSTSLSATSWAFRNAAEARKETALGGRSRPVVGLDASLYLATVVRVSVPPGRPDRLGALPSPRLCIDAEPPLRPLLVNRHGLEQFISGFPPELRRPWSEESQAESLRLEGLKESATKVLERMTVGTLRLRVDLMVDYDQWSREPLGERTTDLQFAREFGRKYPEKYAVDIDEDTSVFAVFDLSDPGGRPVTSQRFSDWKKKLPEIRSGAGQ